MAASRSLSRCALQVLSRFVRGRDLRATAVTGNTSLWGCPGPIHAQCSNPRNVRHQMYSTAANEEEAEDDILFKKLVIEVKGHDVEVINSYEQFVTMAARELDLNVAKISTPKRVFERYTLLKSAHIYKKHRVQYETRTNFRTIELKHLTGSTADTFLEYIQRNLPEGMAMKVSRHRIEEIPSHFKPPTMQESSSI